MFGSMLRAALLVPLSLTFVVACKDAPTSPPSSPPDPALQRRAETLARRVLILDGHVDLPWRLYRSQDPEGRVTEDVSVRTPKGDFDWVRAKAGGLDAPFMSIYTPSSYEEKGGAKAFADARIDAVEGVVARAPDKFALARSPAEVRDAFAKGKIALPMGLENGSPLEGELENLRHFHRRGVRYITLAHSDDNHLADSSYDSRHTNGGLSAFGRQVVAEMNRLGVLVDVSHLSDEATRQAVALSEVPVIASHSGARHFTPGWERNLSDELLRAIADKGGVVQVNFGSSFVDDEARESWDALSKKLRAELKARGLTWMDDAAKPVIERFYQENKGKYATVEQVADHIDYIAKLVGKDHVGLGSDFDGVGDTLPVGLKDASQYPNLIRVLLQRGYSEADVEKICSGNVLRVWQAAEDYAARARAAR